ncbi:hypothetical protein D8S78_23375 [Natrialba swarupiae]|nr:hypothetical protein [Natrialba swarupiae]
MREGLLHGDTAEEVAQHITPMLFSDPMSSPGNIPIADAEKAIILEGEFTHLASEWVEDDVIGRGNKFEVLSDLARSREEILELLAPRASNGGPRGRKRRRDRRDDA